MNSSYNFKILRVLRNRLNLTLEQLAERSGLTYATVAALENNKAQPSLKTLSAIAGALEISTSSLVRLAESRQVQRRRSKFEHAPELDHASQGLEKCRIARYAQGKLIRISAEAGDCVHVMGIHEDVLEFCYVLSGCVSLVIDGTPHDLCADDTMLFDGLLDHAYLQKEKGEYLTVHIPKDDRVLAGLLNEKLREDLDG
jgi:transcriptional regulator with XRE-family HTH domain